MSAVVTTGSAPGGKRLVLADALPLDTPLVVQIFPIYACNLECKFCHFAVHPSRREFITTKGAMPLSLFIMAVDGMKLFESRIRVVRFVGMGEPLLHRHIVSMVRCAVAGEVAETVEILTNGLLLDRGMGRGLVEAGLDKLVVSIQGTSVEKYREVCGREVDFDGLLKNLKWFYENRGDTRVHVKAIDVGLDGAKDEKKFYDMFGPLCDTIGVEKAGPIYRGVEFTDEMPVDGKTQYGGKLSNVKVCPQPFTSLQINPDGKVVPCYSIEYPLFVGSVYEESLYAIWHGAKMRKFRQRMLNGRMGASFNCSVCNIIRHRMSPEDSLDGARVRLKEVYGC